MHAGGCTCNLVCWAGAGQGLIWGTTGIPGGDGSGTAGKYRNWCGRGRTCGDAGAGCGDLQGWTPVVLVLPPDGMQEVSGSAPLSSTVQKPESRTYRTVNTAKYSYGGRLGRRTCVRIGIFPGRGCWQDSGFRTLNRHWPAFHLRKSPCHRFRDSCHRVIQLPGWLFLPATVAAFASSPAALAVLAVRSASRKACWPKPRVR